MNEASAVVDEGSAANQGAMAVLAEFSSMSDQEPAESIMVSNSNHSRRRCFDEAFPSGSESESVTPEPDEVPLQGTSDASRCSSSTEGSSKASSEGTCIVCEAHPGCLKTFSSVREYEDHYNLRHRHKCITCKKSLPSAHILELHVLEAHDTLFSLMAERKPMLACFLESCTTTFWKPEERKEHCLSEHKFPKSFLFWDLTASGGKKSESKSNSKGKSTGKPKDKAKNPSQTKTKNGEKMQTDVSSSTDTPVLESSESMETDTPAVKQKASTKSHSKNQSEKGSQNRPKSVPVQITFGHSASRVFRPKYTFGLHKPASEEGVCSSSKMEMDLSDIKDVLPATTTTTSTSAME